MGRSIKASIAGLKVAKQALQSKEWNKTEFAREVDCTRQTVHQFFKGEPIDRSNFEGICEKLGLQWEQVAELKPFDAESEVIGGPLRLNSRFYIQRDDVESRCYKVIKEPGAFLRIRGYRGTGKTSLLIRVGDEARRQDYKLIYINLETPDRKKFSTLREFLRYVCVLMSDELGKEARLDQYWNEDLGCNDSTKDYFEEYLLRDLDAPLVFILDNFDRVFRELEPKDANDFCGLIRTWHEAAMHSTEIGKTWQQLRLVIAHSTEFYGLTDTYFSPFEGIREVVSLEDFSQKQGDDLVKQHGLNFPPSQVEQLMDLVGGHPYLFQLALNFLKSPEVSLEKLLQTAPTEREPFGNHLRQLLGNLQEHSHRKTYFYQVITANAPVRLGSIEAFKLQGMGLVKQQDDGWIPRCKLYSQFFSREIDLQG